MNKPLNPWKLTGYKAGQNVVCKVTATEPGGYGVIIPKDNLPGFLPTEAKLKVGEEILAQFVCVHNNRILLSSKFVNIDPGNTQSTPQPKSPQQIDWAEQLKTGVGPISDAEAAFGIWSQTAPRTFHLKRATDLILPPFSDEAPNIFKVSDYDLEWLITDLEGGMRTCCVKAISETRKSRSAMILYHGRAVGCIYGSKEVRETLPTQQSLHMMMADLSLPETEVMVYNLPEAVTLAMSSLFLGYPVQRSDNLDARSYFDYLLGWFAEKEQTACFAISLQESAATCLAFVHKGQYVGCFYVEDQKFNADKDYVYQLIASDPGAGLEASILPQEMISAAVRFGFSLSMVRPRS